MSDESRTPDLAAESQGFDRENRGLHERTRCGASISASSEFCRFGGRVSVSGILPAELARAPIV
jgi:hypothetical protein